ncbi:LOW QUALITY PROTEIN: NACHT domain- and WD repeat-containing protein 1 [Morphnus guianensis]
MATERETLLEKAYPEAQAFCQKHGLMFEVIDLRWGISELVDPDHRNTQLSLEETEACQKLSLGPTFIISSSTAVHTQFPMAKVRHREQATCTQKVYWTTIEWEIEQGLLNTQKSNPGAFICLREGEDSNRQIGQATNSELLEEEDNLDSEAKQLLSNLKAKIASHYPKHLKVHTLAYSKDSGNPRCKEKISEEPGRLLQELGHHTALCLKYCRFFCGRQNLSDSIFHRIRQNNDKNHTTLILYGLPGCGKTAVMCKLSERVQAVLGQDSVVVIRLLRTSQLRSAIHSLLRDIYCPPKVHIIISISTAEPDTLKALQHTVPEAEAYSEVGPSSCEEGEEMLEMLLASDTRRLSPAQWAYFHQSFPSGGQALLFKLAFHEARKWVSYTSLSEVVIASTAQDATHRLSERLEKSHSTVLVAHVLGYIASSRISFHISHFTCRNGLSDTELKDILSLDDEVLSEIHHCHVPSSKTILRLPPLRWARLHSDMGECLAEWKADGFTLLCFAHGYFLWDVPVPGFQAPCLESSPFLNSDSAETRKSPAPAPCSSTSITFSLPKQVVEMMQIRYLSKQDQIKRHFLLADFFKGTWSWGMKKPLTLPHLSRTLNADRKVAPQPLWFSDTVANLRKLSELPFHLLKAGRIEELKQDVLGKDWARGGALQRHASCLQPQVRITTFLHSINNHCEKEAQKREIRNMNWISCKIIASGIESVVDDFAMCTECISCPELRLVQDILLLLKPAVSSIHSPEGVSIIYTEMLARLLFFVPSYPEVPTMAQRLSGIWKFLRCCMPFLGTLVNAWHLETAELIFQISGEASDAWMCSAVFSPRLVIMTVSEGGMLSLWNSNTGELRSNVSYQGYRKKHQHPSILLRLPYPSAQVDKHNTFYPAALHSFAQYHAAKLNVTANLYSFLQERGSSAILTSCLTLALLLCRSLLMETVCLEKLPGRVRFAMVSEDESILAAGFEEYVRVYLANPKGFHRFLLADLKHEGVVHTAVISAGNSIIVTGSQAASIQVGREEGWASSQSEASLTDPAYRILLRCYPLTLLTFLYKLVKGKSSSDTDDFSPPNFSQVWSLLDQGLLTDTLDGMGPLVTLLDLCDCTLVSASHSAPYLGVWNLIYNHRQKTLAPVPNTGCAALSHGGNYVYFTQPEDIQKVIIWNATESEVRDTLDTSAQVRCLEIAEQNQLLFTGLVSGTVLVFSLNSRQDVACIPPPESQKPVNDMAINKQEKQLAIAYDDLVLVLDIMPADPCPVINRPTYTFKTQIPGSLISSVAVLGDYRVLYGMTSCDLFLYDCPRAQVFPLEGHRSQISCLESSHGEQ